MKSGQETSSPDHFSPRGTLAVAQRGPQLPRSYLMRVSVPSAISVKGPPPTDSSHRQV